MNNLKPCEQIFIHVRRFPEKRQIEQKNFYNNRPARKFGSLASRCNAVCSINAMDMVTYGLHLEAQ